MESQLSVLLYSKYSSLSKSLMNMIQTSGVDFTTKFSLQPLCIDNEEIRARILKNTQLQVTTVPCLLIIFPDGGIEKYDGARVFEWVEGIIRQFAPPPPPPPVRQQPSVPSEEEKWRMKQVQQAREQERIQNERKRVAEENRRKYHEKYEKERTPSPERERQRSPSPPPPMRRRRVRKESPEPRRQEPAVTSIDDLDDLPSDEDDDVAADRYRSRRPVGRIRTDEGNYEEGKELFQGPPPNMRRARRSAVKGESHTGNDAKSQKSADIMAKAKAMAKGREDTHAPPPGHPANQRN
uniref:Thioredoxin domain-containing protein n=1 Tax=viral metagenome TaxID=1070528 RepID=A0A6C0JPM9_9ZZZZ